MEDKLVLEATSQFTELTSIPAKWKLTEAVDKHTGIDGYIEIGIGKDKVKYLVEVKNSFHRSNLHHLIKLKEKYSNLLLIVPDLYTAEKKILRKANINYLDTSGNAYLHDGKVFILIDGKRKKVNKSKFKSRAFTKSGLKVLYTLIINPSLINESYRYISDVANVSIDTIHKVLASLQELGYMHKVDSNNRMLSTDMDLREKWIEAYDLKLKPSIKLGVYRFQNETDRINWKELAVNSHSQWGGEAGASLLTKYLRPETLTLYTSLKKSDLITTFRLVPDNKGDVEVYEKFWNTEEHKGPVAHPFLIYADLVNSGDGRNIEVAEQIKSQHDT